jgi:tRNA nucleotidyltransferase (CCA-adding enzyme)
VNATYQFAAKFESQSSNEVFNFFIKTDALRRQDRFAALLATFELLSIDVSRLIKLRDLLNVIDVETLDKSDIGAAIKAEKRRIIDLFLDTAATPHAFMCQMG